MSGLLHRIRTTASRIYKRKNDDDTRELKLLQDSDNPYQDSRCFSLHKACSVGDNAAVKWYIENQNEELNKPDKNGRLPIFYAIQQNHFNALKTLVRAGADVNLMSDLMEGVDACSVHIAAKFGRLECLKFLVESGGDVNARNCFGLTPLHAAAREKLSDCVEALLQTGRADVNVGDNNNVTPLHIVMIKGSSSKKRTDVVKMLLDYGADPFVEDYEGETAFHEAAKNGADDGLKMLIEYPYSGILKCKRSSTTMTDVLNKPQRDGFNCLHLAVEHGHEKVIQICIDHKVDINKKTFNGDAALHLACSKGNLNVCKMLIENGADQEIVDNSGKLPIHRVAIKGNLECLSYLIEKGAHIDKFHRCGPALVAASFNRRSEAVRFILEAGAKATQRNSLMDTCLHLAVRNSDLATVKVIMQICGTLLLELKDRSDKRAIHLAAQKGDPEVMKVLLSYKPDLTAADQNGKKAIHIASEHGNTECAKLLLEEDKSCIDATDFLWRTPLHLSNMIEGKDKNMTKLLLDYGSDPNGRDDRRWTPLFYVAFNGCPCSTEMLVNAGAAINEYDKNGMTALHIAASQNNAKALKTLLKYGADVTILNSKGLCCLDVALANRFHDVCAVIANSDKWREAVVSPTTMEMCITVSPETAKIFFDKCIVYSGRNVDTDYTITYNFDLLDPHPDENDSYYGPMVIVLERRNELLTHPLTKKLLRVNWKRGVRHIYYPSMCVIGIVMIALINFLIFNKDITKKCYFINDELNNLTELNFRNSTFCAEKVDYSKYRMLFTRGAILLYFVFYLLKEIKQLYKERWAYFTDILNLFDITVSCLFIEFVRWPSSEPIPYDRMPIGIAGLFGYTFLVFLWTRGLSRFGIYITMFLEVLGTLLKALVGFGILIFGFAATFTLLFFRDQDFGTLYDSALKVQAMMLGELDYVGYRHLAQREMTSSSAEILAVAIFVIFSFTMSLVVNNLLIGLAVGDIESVQKNAEIKLLSLQVHQIMDARYKMPGFIRRRVYLKTLIKQPNKEQPCKKDQRGAKEYQRRKEKNQKKKKKSIYDSMLDVSLLKSSSDVRI